MFRYFQWVLCTVHEIHKLFFFVKNFIKNWSYGTIHTFTVFSVFQFSVINGIQTHPISRKFISHIMAVMHYNKIMRNHCGKDSEFFILVCMIHNLGSTNDEPYIRL